MVEDFDGQSEGLDCSDGKLIVDTRLGGEHGRFEVIEEGLLVVEGREDRAW